MNIVTSQPLTFLTFFPQKNNMVSFEIRWSAKKFLIDLNDEEYNAMTVGDLKLKCQQLTEIEPQYMKLLAHGGKTPV
jgi:hypothetical protein